MKVEIKTTDFQAQRAAKQFFATTLGIKKSNVRVRHSQWDERRWGSTQCVCGETRAVFFEMSNAGPKQQQTIANILGNINIVVKYGICPYCGDKH